MAGLLDGLGGLSGDDTVKDQFGQTQSDRRDPLWAGLIRAGLLGVAGGSNIMPEQRAAYLAQAGGAIADIPGQMVANQSAAAQQMLRGQQLDEGKRKIADRDRVRAISQTPEFQAAIKNAKGADKIAIQAAIDTGDMGALNTAIGNLDKSGLNAEKLDLREREFKLKQEKAEAALTAQGGWGNSFEGRAREILKRGRIDPAWLATPEGAVAYAQAHEYLSTERPVTVGQTSMILPKLKDIDDYPKPTSTPAPTSPTATNPQPTQPQQPPVVKDNPDGSRSWPNPQKPTETMTEYPDGSLKVTDADGRTVRSEGPQKVDPHLVQKLTEIEAAEAKVQNAGKSFIEAWKNPSAGDRWGALTGGPSNMMEAWTNLAALIKESAVFNLGVLNGGDQKFIEGAIQNPAAWMAQWKGDEKTAQRQVQRIFDILAAGKKVYAEKVKPPSRAPKATAPAEKPKTYNPQTDSFE